MKSVLLSTIFFSSLVGTSYSRGFRASVSRNSQTGLARPDRENVTLAIPGIGGTRPGQGDMGLTRPDRENVTITIPGIGGTRPGQGDMGLTRPDRENVTITIPGIGGTRPGQGDMGLTLPDRENVTITIPGIGGTRPGQGDMDKIWEGFNMTEVNATEISSLNLTDSLPLPSDIGLDEATADEILEEATAALEVAEELVGNAEEMIEMMTPDEAQEMIDRLNQTLTTTQEELQQTYQNVTQDEVITMAQTAVGNVQDNAVVQQVSENIAENVQNTIGNTTAVGTQVAENLADRVENSGVDPEAVEAAVQEAAEQARAQMDCRQDCATGCGETSSTIREFTRCNKECTATCL